MQRCGDECRRQRGLGIRDRRGCPVGGAPKQAVQALSAGTSALELWRTVNADIGCAFAENGRTVCRFEPGREHERSGTEPDRLLPALRRA
ncbi:DUF6461 domain-containing protein [Streptomyces olivaceoviridis]